jgi:hypothetical protein
LLLVTRAVLWVIGIQQTTIRLVLAHQRGVLFIPLPMHGFDRRQHLPVCESRIIKLRLGGIVRLWHGVACYRHTYRSARTSLGMSRRGLLRNRTLGASRDAATLGAGDAGKLAVREEAARPAYTAPRPPLAPIFA